MRHTALPVRRMAPKAPQATRYEPASFWRLESFTFALARTLLGDDRVELAASLPWTLSPSDGADLPFAAICLFEEVAAGEAILQTTYGRAPCLCLTGPALFSVRTLALIPYANIQMIDALRSHMSGIGSIKAESEHVSYFELYAKVSNNKTPVHIRCPAEGFLKPTRL